MTSRRFPLKASDMVEPVSANGPAINKASFLCGLVVTASAAIAYPAISTAQSKCEVQGKASINVVVVCPEGLSKDDWVVAGKAACPTSDPCNAWIWDDADKAPALPPSLSNPMHWDYVISAVAVWINKAQVLNMCTRNLSNYHSFYQWGGAGPKCHWGGTTYRPGAD